MIYREVAKELSTSDRSISEISVRVGFNDPNYFSKKFKKATSYTPKVSKRFIVESNRDRLKTWALSIK